MKKKIVSWIFIFLVSLAIILGVLGANGVLGGKTEKIDTIRFVCDAFFVAGVVIGGIGLLIIVSNKGVFNGLTYSVSSLFRLHFSTKRYTWQEKETYADYQDRKREKVKGDRSFIPFLIYGVIYIMVSIILLSIYYNI